MQRKVQLCAKEEKKKKGTKRKEKYQLSRWKSASGRRAGEVGNLRRYWTKVRSTEGTTEEAKRKEGEPRSFEWGVSRGGYHAMRHVRVTSRGRSREHRVLSVTCPVTRSPLHPLSTLLPRRLYRRPLVLLSRRKSQLCAALLPSNALYVRIRTMPLLSREPIMLRINVAPLFSPFPSPFHFLWCESFKIAFFDWVSR